MTPVIIIALTIWMEAKGETYRGRSLVADVIYNRATNEGKTLQDICTAPKQFSCWDNTPVIDNSKLCGPVWKHCLELAKAMHEGRYVPLTNSTHFYNPTLCDPEWAKKLEKVTTEKNHVFMRQ